MPTRCNRDFYCRSYCLLNMFRASLCPSSGAQEYYTAIKTSVVFSWHFISTYLYRIYSIPTRDKDQWLLLQFIVLLMMDAKGVRNMWSILVVVNKHNTARVASCWFIIYYRLVMHGNSNIKFVASQKPNLKIRNTSKTLHFTACTSLKVL